MLNICLKKVNKFELRGAHVSSLHTMTMTNDLDPKIKEKIEFIRFNLKIVINKY